MVTDPVVTIQAVAQSDSSALTVERGDVRRAFTARRGKEAQTLTSVLISEFGMSQPDAIAFAIDRVTHAGDAAIAAAETAAA